MGNQTTKSEENYGSAVFEKKEAELRRRYRCLSLREKEIIDNSIKEHTKYRGSELWNDRYIRKSQNSYF
jgi:hypothetical protein